jgi:formylglycine-generating enzyme required for sulfatase activity
LEVHFYPGLSVPGAVGSVQVIQYADELAEPAVWRCLAIVQLTNHPHLHVDTTMPARERRFYRAVPGPQNITWIPPGTFLLGSPGSEVGRQSNEGPQTQVTLTRGFFMGKHEVTQGEYLAVTGVNPSAVPGDASLPVDMVSWLDAVAYCEKLTQREMLAGRVPEGWKYRLPTEAEWEYACRAGTISRYSHGNDADYSQLSKYAWFGDPTGGRTHPVETKLPNPWGLYDMHGNVWELCQDAVVYSGGSVIDPPSAGGAGRMTRGGSWHSLGPRCRSASRNPYTTTNSEPWVGFRVVLAPDRP